MKCKAVYHHEGAVDLDGGLLHPADHRRPAAAWACWAWTRLGRLAAQVVVRRRCFGRVRCLFASSHNLLIKLLDGIHVDQGFQESN